MVATFLSLIDGNRRQAAQLDLAAQRIDDTQHVFEAHSGFPRLEVDDEAHSYPCGERQLGLCQPELLAGGTQGIAKLLRGSNGCHGLFSFPFGKLSAASRQYARNIYRSGSLYNQATN